MRRSVILFGAIASTSALVIPAQAATSAPSASDCVAAAEAGRAYWQARAGKDPEAAQRETALATMLLDRLGPQEITPEQRKKYKELVPDLRDVFVRRCLMKHPAP